MMNSIFRKSSRTKEHGLDHVVEPLASYICAAERPGAVLKHALAALIREVEQTNRLANARVAALRERGIALPA